MLKKDNGETTNYISPAKVLVNLTFMSFSNISRSDALSAQRTGLGRTPRWLCSPPFSIFIWWLAGSHRCGNRICHNCDIRTLIFNGSCKLKSIEYLLGIWAVMTESYLAMGRRCDIHFCPSHWSATLLDCLFNIKRILVWNMAWETRCYYV